jgi:hypothetical protein
VTGSVVGLRVLANAIESLFNNKDIGGDTKISLSVNRSVVSPACMVGVRVSRPNFRVRCGRTKL